jgi:MFS transporter, DHA1 family, inner membrane transport protein
VTFPPAAGRARLPLVVLVLAAGTFLMGSTEFMVAGLLPEMAADLHVSVAHAGLLITAFAVGMIVGSPTMAILTLRLPRDLTLRLALVIFALGHVLVALSTSFPIVLVARVITALATGAFWAVSAVVATEAAGPGARSRAVGVVIGGLTLANVVGVPLGSLAGQLAGWRGPFWGLAVLALAAAAVIGRFIPPPATERRPSIRAEFAALRSTNLWLALGASAAIMGGVLATYTYISPLLTERAGIPARFVPLVLIGFGAGTLAGVTVGGRLGDLRPLLTTLTAAVATVVVLLALAGLSTHSVAAVALIAAMGVTGFAVNPVVTALAVQSAGAAPTLASALSTSGFNCGIAAGSWIGGRALDSSLGAVGPVLVGAVIAATTLIPLGVLAARRVALTR